MIDNIEIMNSTGIHRMNSCSFSSYRFIPHIEKRVQSNKRIHGIIMKNGAIENEKFYLKVDGSIPLFSSKRKTFKNGTGYEPFKAMIMGQF